MAQAVWSGLPVQGRSRSGGSVLWFRQSVGPGPQPAAAGGLGIQPAKQLSSGSWCCMLNKLMEKLLEELGVEFSE